MKRKALPVFGRIPNGAGMLSKVILYGSLCIIGVLAIPVCVFLVPIFIVWTIADKLLQGIEKREKR